jgi:dipeptidyl aminopeptidase/acylaminoacyl peptidase
LEFIKRVYGEMGGDDTQDYIAGVESLIADGVVDGSRVAVTGGSYGGYMSSWLITQTDIFAAAIPIAEVSNWTSQHFTCNIPFFDTLFLGSQVNDLAGHHLTRSPVFLADKVTTPSLHITGALDRCTPAGQALEFHRALREAGQHSELVTYPQEAHGVRQFPAVIDFTARVIDFLATHCPA